MELFIGYAKCFWHMEIITDIQFWQIVNFSILIVICVRKCMTDQYEYGQEIPQPENTELTHDS